MQTITENYCHCLCPSNGPPGGTRDTKRRIKDLLNIRLFNCNCLYAFERQFNIFFLMKTLMLEDDIKSLRREERCYNIRRSILVQSSKIIDLDKRIERCIFCYY